MALGSTAKKVQQMADLAEKLYQRVQELYEQTQEVSETVTETNERVAELEAELAEQRDLLEAVAEAQGVDASELDDGDDNA